MSILYEAVMSLLIVYEVVIIFGIETAISRGRFHS
jgi:hypothetical protein